MDSDRNPMLNDFYLESFLFFDRSIRMSPCNSVTMTGRGIVAHPIIVTDLEKALVVRRFLAHDALATSTLFRWHCLPRP